MKPKYILVLIILAGVLFLSGCNMPGPEVKCPPADLVAPSLIAPGVHAQITNLNPTLLWSFEAVIYPYPMPYPTPSVAYNCSPDRFKILLAMSPDFVDYVGSNYYTYYLKYSWTSPTLQNGKAYRWSVVPIRDGFEGPASVVRYFSIGPPCTSANLGAPVLLSPPNGSTVQTTNPKVMYDTLLDCLPKGYVAEISQYPIFTNKRSLGGGYSGYGLPIPELENCATYYWRVAGYINSTSSLGPYSDTWSFDVHLPNTICSSMIEIPELIPELIPSPPPDPGDWIWEVIRDARCRLGPASLYPETGFLPIGHMAKILGRNEDGTWFQVVDPLGRACWGSIIAFDVPEGWETLEVSRYDPLPTATPTIIPPTPTPTIVPPYNCAEHIDRSSCSAQFPVCIWDPKVPACKNN